MNGEVTVNSPRSMEDRQIFVTKTTPRSSNHSSLHQDSFLIRPSSTFESEDHSADEEDHIDSRCSRQGSSLTELKDDVPQVDTDDTSRTPQHEKLDSVRDSDEDEVLTTLYIAVFSFFGCILRNYMARFFGLDCEWRDGPEEVHDFLSPIFSQICITASGKTEQHGGALFIDLPANMLGW
jgi:hypothetical protein